MDVKKFGTGITPMLIVASSSLLLLEICFTAWSWRALESREIEAQCYALIASLALVANLFCFGAMPEKEKFQIMIPIQIIFCFISVGFQAHNIYQTLSR